MVATWSFTYPLLLLSENELTILPINSGIPRWELSQFHRKLTGRREEGEKITLKVVRLEDLWREGARDAKALAAFALYRGLKDAGKI